MQILNIFGAEKITLDKIIHFKNSAPDIIIWAAPAMFFFVLVEYIISYRQNKKYYNKKETMRLESEEINLFSEEKEEPQKEEIKPSLFDEAEKEENTKKQTLTLKEQKI